MERARERAQQRRAAHGARPSAPTRPSSQDVATPVTRQVANALKVGRLRVHGLHARRRPAPRVGPRPRRLRRVRARHRRRPPAGRRRASARRAARGRSRTSGRSKTGRLARRRSPRRTCSSFCSTRSSRGWSGKPKSQRPKRPTPKPGVGRASVTCACGFRLQPEGFRGHVNRHQSAEHRDHAHVGEPLLLQQARDAVRAGIVADRLGDVAIGVRIAVQRRSRAPSRRRSGTPDTRRARAALSGRLKSSESSRPPGDEHAMDLAQSPPRGPARSSGRIRSSRRRNAPRQTAAPSCRRTPMQGVHIPRRRLALASCSMRCVTSRPTAVFARGAAANRMSPVPQARSSTRSSGVIAARRISALLPAPVLSVGEKPCDEVVAVGDGGKEPPHVAALAVGRGEARAKRQSTFRRAFHHRAGAGGRRTRRCPASSGTSNVTSPCSFQSSRSTLARRRPAPRSRASSRAPRCARTIRTRSPALTSMAGFGVLEVAVEIERHVPRRRA